MKLHRQVEIMISQPSLPDSLYVKPFRPDRKIIRVFIKYYTYFVGGFISLIISASLWPALQFWTVIIILGYMLYVLVRIWAQNKKEIRKYYTKPYVQVFRFLFLISAVTLLLIYVYRNPLYIKNLGNDALWLLYLPAISAIGQRGDRRVFLGSLLLTVFLIYLVTPTLGKNLISLPKPITFDIFLRATWLVFLAGTSYVLQRYMSDAIADLNLIINIQNKIREIEATLLRSKTEVEEHTYLEKAVEIIKNDLDYDHVNVFKVDTNKKKLIYIAAACNEGKHLASQGFEIDIDEQKSIVSKVAKTNEMYLANNATYDANYMPHQAFPKTKAELVIPIVVRNRVYGVLDIQVHQSQYFLNQDQKAVEILANQIGWVIDNSDQFGHISWINRIIETIADPIFTQNHLEDTLQEIADTAYKELETDLVLLYSYDPGNKDGVMGPIYSGHVYHPELMQNPLKSKTNIIWRVIEDEGKIYLNENLNIHTPQEHPLFRPSEEQIKSGIPTFIEREKIQAHAVVRLLIRNQCVGVLFMNFRSPREFSAWDKRRYYSFAHLAALAIHKMQLQQHFLQNEKNELSNMFHDMLIADSLGVHKILKSIDLVDDSTDKVAEKIDLAIEGTQILNDDLRNILRLLKEDSYKDLQIELERFFFLLQRIFKVQIKHSWSGDLREVSDEVARQLYLVVREALTNSIRHGKAADIYVTAEVKKPKFLELKIVDDGIGFNPDYVKRMNGLLSMRYRVVEIIGGEFDLDSHPGKGTRIYLSVPLEIITKEV